MRAPVVAFVSTGNASAIVIGPDVMPIPFAYALSSPGQKYEHVSPPATSSSTRPAKLSFSYGTPANFDGSIASSSGAAGVDAGSTSGNAEDDAVGELEPMSSIEAVGDAVDSENDALASGDEDADDGSAET